MPRGQADYGIYTQTSLPGGMSDIGEAAARLGSINVFDRRGWLAMMDDFESPVLKWQGFGVAGGVAPFLSAAQAARGSQCVYLSNAIGAGSWSGLIRNFALVRLGRVGFEWWVQQKLVANSYQDMRLDFYDGTNRTQAIVLYDAQAGTINITTPLGNIEVATGIYMTQSGWYFLPIKCVADMDTDQYVRLLVGEREIDISAHALVTVGPTALRVIAASMTLYGTALATTEAYCDNFILTVSEP